MKVLVLSVLCLFSFPAIQAQFLVAGSFSKDGKDSTACQIAIPKSIFGDEELSKLFYKVRVADSAGQTTVYKPDDISGFQFAWKGQVLRFYAKPTITEKNLRFLQALERGTNSNLYFFSTINQNGSAQGVFYTLEKPGGEYLFLNTGVRNLNKIREQLKEFYKENKETISEIDTRFIHRAKLHADIVAVVRFCNSR